MKKLSLLIVSIFIGVTIIAIVANNVLKKQPTTSEDVKQTADVVATQSPKKSEELEDVRIEESDHQELSSMDADVFQDAHAVLSEIMKIEKSKSQQNKKEEIARKKIQELVQQPQVIHGAVKLPELIENSIPFQMAVRSKHAVVPVIVSKGGFASPKLSPGSYKLILYQTDKTPGMRIEGIKVTEDVPINKVAFTPQNSIITLVVKDEIGKVVSGANVTVCKVGSTGTNKNLVTFMTGQTDEEGRFTAKGMADGRYAVSAEFEDRKIRRPLDLEVDKDIVFDLEIPNE